MWKAWDLKEGQLRTFDSNRFVFIQWNLSSRNKVGLCGWLFAQIQILLIYKTKVTDCNFDKMCSLIRFKVRYITCFAAAVVVFIWNYHNTTSNSSMWEITILSFISAVSLVNFSSTNFVSVAVSFSLSWGLYYLICVHLYWRRHFRSHVCLGILNTGVFLLV